MKRKEGASVTIGTHAQQYKIKPRGTIFLKRALQLSLVCLGAFLEREGGIDGVDVLGGDGDMPEEVLVAGPAVALPVVQADAPLVCKEYHPPFPLYAVFQLKQTRRDQARKGASGKGHQERTPRRNGLVG